MIPSIKRGDSIRDPRALNEVIRQVNTLALGFGEAFPKVRQSGNALFILNRTGHDLQPGEAFPFYSGAAHPFTDNPERLFSGTAAIADMPSPVPATVEWGLAAEAIADGKSGWGYDSGVLLARIASDDSTDTSLDFDPNDLEWWYAKRGTTGPARILWADTEQHGGSGEGAWVWALVRLGAASAAGLSIVQAIENGSGGLVEVKALQFLEDLSASPNFEQTGDEFEAKYFKL